MGSLDNSFYAVNPDGSLKWPYQTGGDIGSSPAIGADGTVYEGSYDDSLYAFEETNGGMGDTAWPKFCGNSRNTGNQGSSY